MRTALTLGFCDQCGREVPTRKALFAEGNGKPRKRRVCMVHGTPTRNLNAWSTAIPTKDATGRLRGSRKEANRGNWLLAASQAGKITNLRLCNDHPRETFRFEVYGTAAVDRLVQAMREEAPYLVDALSRLIQDVERSKRRLHTYTPDFSYDDDRGVHHVEDTKGRVTDRFRLNKILMEACFDITVEEP